MKKLFPVLFVAVLVCASAGVYAETASFGVASAFTLVALDGNITDTGYDVTGRLAASGNISGGNLTIGTYLSGVTPGTGVDPWGTQASGYAIVSGGTLSATSSVQIQGGGNVYANSNTATIYYNDGGHTVTGGTDPINFSTLATTLYNESQALSTLSQTGVVENGSLLGDSSSWLVLKGTSSTLNVFTLTQAEFDSSSIQLDINVPTGSTVIINVQGASDTLNLPVLFDGTQESDSNNDDGDILFNFASATSLTIDQQVDAAVLAPDAALTDNAGQIGGTIMAASIAVDGGEVHNLEFTGTLPSVTVTPEPGTLLLLGTGMLFVVWLAGRRQLALQRLVGKQG